MESIWYFILNNLEPAGNIGSYVAISIFGFAISSFYIKKKYQKVTTEIGPKWFHPVLGSFFGAIPGCGATIVVASLYKNQNISFGGLFAAFISTLGEGSFVLLGVSDEAENVFGNLEVYAIITIFGFVAGIISGYLIDIFKWRTNTKNIQENIENTKIWRPFLVEKFIFYSIIIISILLAPGSIMAFWKAEIKLIAELTKYAMILLTILCLLYYLLSTFVYKRHNCHCDHDNLKSVISHAILDISMVVSYVFIGLVLSNYVIDEMIGVEKFKLWMQSSAFIVVLIAALVGLTPGCGGMIIVATTYLNNIDHFPLAALIAAAIATSGDGIFPLIAQNKKDGLLVSLIGLVIALVVGYIALIMQVSITN